MTHQELEPEVWRLFGMLDEPVRNPIRKQWLKHLRADELPPILTDPEHVAAAAQSLGYQVDIAATDGISMYFRLNRMNECGWDPRLVILHEWAHCYFFAVGKFSLRKYAEDERHRRKCEQATEKLSEMWFKRIRHQDELAVAQPS